MKISVKSNMYTHAADTVRKRYGAHISGNGLGLACVVSGSPLPDHAQDALRRSFEKLGYGSPPSAFVTTQKPKPLLPGELFSLIEGLDPYALVITDESALAICTEAYRQLIEPDRSQRVLGRDVCALSSFVTMLDSDEGKQRAWALLKKLPSLN